MEKRGGICWVDSTSARFRTIKMKPLPLKIQDVHRNHRYGIVIHSFTDLMQKGRAKLQLDNVHSDADIRICQEDDGTFITDDQFLQNLPSHSALVFLIPGQEWTGYWSYVITAFEKVKKIHPLYQVQQRIESLNITRDSAKLSAISTFLTALDHNREADSRKDDPSWFADLPKTATSKEQVMVNGAKSRIRGYFYGARKLVQQTIPPSVYTKTFQPIFDTFQFTLQKNDFYGSLFGRRSPEHLRLCDGDGWFNCEGPFDADLCAMFHLIDPYDNKESRILFSTWNLDHQIEKSRQIVPGLIEAIQKKPPKAELNWKYFYDLLFTKVNLRLVHIVCHKKCEHSSKIVSPEEFYNEAVNSISLKSGESRKMKLVKKGTPEKVVGLTSEKSKKSVKGKGMTITAAAPSERRNARITRSSNRSRT